MDIITFLTVCLLASLFLGEHSVFICSPMIIHLAFHSCQKYLSSNRSLCVSPLHLYYLFYIVLIFYNTLLKWSLPWMGIEQTTKYMIQFFFCSNSLGTKIVLFIYKYSHFIKCVYIILTHVQSSKYNYHVKQRKFISILASRNFAM